jgi:hypothetical protein
MSSKDVKLNIMTRSSEGFTETTSVAGTHYWYKYTGGNSGSNNGNQGFSSADSFEITFIGSATSGYKFSAFKNKDICNDLTAAVTDDKVTVTDSCVTSGDFDYGVTVTIGTGTDTIDCDPRISNTPRR